MKRVQALQPLGRDQPFRWQWMLMYICTTTGRSLARFSLVIAETSGLTWSFLQLTQGNPLKRNFVHVNDLVSCMLAALDNPAAKQQKFNVCMDEPVDYVRIVQTPPFRS